MCNVFLLLGENRRRNGSRPNIIHNENKQQAKEKVSLVNGAELERESKQILEDLYQEFLAGTLSRDNLSIEFYSLKGFGVVVVEDEDYQQYLEEATKTYVPEVKFGVENNRERIESKKHLVTARAQTKSVYLFFEKMNTGGAKSIFNEVKVILPFDKHRLGENSVMDVIIGKKVD